MNKDFKSELDAELKSHVTRLSERKREQEESRASEDELHAAFKKKCRTVVIPIFKQFSDYVKPLGWDSKIHLKEDQMIIPTDNGWIKHAEPITFVMMLFCQGEWSADKMRGAPYFAIVCDYRMESIFFHSLTVSTRKRDFTYRNYRIELAELTRRKVRENLVEYFYYILRETEED